MSGSKVARSRRPRTAIELSSRHKRNLIKKQGMLRRPRTATAPSSSISKEQYEEDFEVVEYEWPDLPPIRQYKAALIREDVSKGLPYLLPADKIQASAGFHRTDLRLMFKQPFKSQPSFSSPMFDHLKKYSYDFKHPQSQNGWMKGYPVDDLSSETREILGEYLKNEKPISTSYRIREKQLHAQQSLRGKFIL